ncbi:hypothetical protein K2173_023545 [Erythroxylum novogranatense]|uniref:Uncharacterized protein n=1 Tax=Erythroxylum novogranatense TaxID=1862640 RepID=A0AAV8TNX6_9ROSI|nr:hypothetical protein K2173_023545 [Erythroxylum novogranatense]
MDIDLTLLLKTSVQLDRELLQVGHSTATCPQPRPVLDEGRTTTATSSVAPEGGSLGLGTAAVQPPVDNRYKPWVYVQRKTRQPTQQLQQITPPTKSRQTSLGRRNESPQRTGSRFAALTAPGLMETVEEPSAEAPQQNPLMGSGQRLPLTEVIDPNKPSLHGQIFKANGPNPNARKGTKGPQGIEKQLLRGESSQVSPILNPSPVVTPQIQIQPTNSDKKHSYCYPFTHKNDM